MEASAFTDVKDALSEAGYAFATAELSMIPQVVNEVPDDKKEQFERMIDALEDDDDVQEVYTNADGF